ncbi:LacI family transcriptional regulator [Betaproteobacteria bacterium GR16-43]|nr:LacI family transcriptional regulator [Betaproteobacteria bacterium GR16-43]
MMLRRSILGLAAAAFATAAAAQSYPSKPIKLVVPFPPAGGTDILARTVANKLTEMNKWTVVVDNKPGAGGNIGVDATAKSAPDGYTVVMGQTSNLTISPSLYAKLPYDPVKDLEPVVLVGSGPIAIVVRADSRFKTLADLLKEGKEKPGTLMMASPGNGTVAHLAGVRLMNVTGAKFEHVPYKGSSGAVPDLLGGSVDFYLSSLPTLQSHISGGKMRALAVTSPKRSPVIASVPTVGETVKGFDANTWFGILAPAGTPKPVIATLNAEINKILKDPAVRKAIEAEGGEVLGGTPEQFKALIKNDLASWAKEVKSSGAKVD